MYHIKISHNMFLYADYSSNFQQNLELKHKRPIDVPDLAKKTSCVLVLFVFLAINMKPLRYV